MATPVTGTRSRRRGARPRKEPRVGPSTRQAPAGKTFSRYFGGAKREVPRDALGRDLSSGVPWTPPRSPYNLLEETVFHDPWRLLISTIFLTKTRAIQCAALLWTFFDRWPTVDAAANADWTEIAAHLKPIGMHNVRAKRIVRMSDEFGRGQWDCVSELHGIGDYGRDAYRIFVKGEQVVPKDHALQAYTRWMDEHVKSGTGAFPATPAIPATTLGTPGTRVAARGGKRGVSDNDDNNSGC